MIIEVPHKIYIKNSPVHGLGVFAKERIYSEEIIEVCPLFTWTLEPNKPDPCLNDYRYNWPKSENWTHQAVAWGYGSLYNHSNTPNADWRDNQDKTAFEIYAIRDIEINEEIFTYYGGNEYWGDGRNHVNVL